MQISASIDYKRLSMDKPIYKKVTDICTNKYRDKTFPFI